MPRVELPPVAGERCELPALPDPAYGGQLGPYAVSSLRGACGTRINPDAVEIYSKLSVAREVLTCAHPDLEEFIENHEGFDGHCNLRQPPLADWPLSAVVRRIKFGGGGALDFEFTPATYAVDYVSCGSPRPSQPPSKEWAMHIREKLPAGSQLILTFFGDRSLIDGLWAQEDFWDMPFLDQFDAIVPLGFNQFSDAPRVTSLCAERKDQIFVQEGSERGRNVIPTVAWSNETSLRRQVELWVSNPHVNTVCLDTHGPGMDSYRWSWRSLYAIEKHCAPHTHIRWLIAGLCSGWQIRELRRIFPNGNFAIVSGLGLYINSMVGIADRGIRAAKFERSIRKLEDFRTGKVIATKKKRPDHWPTYAESKKSAQAKK